MGTTALPVVTVLTVVTAVTSDVLLFNFETTSTSSLYNCFQSEISSPNCLTFET